MRIFRALVVTWITAALLVGVAPLASAKPGDKATAKKALITIDDLRGSGWTSQERDPDSEKHGNEVRGGIDECAGVQGALDSSKKYRTAGPNFRKRASTGAQSLDDTVYVFPDVKAARRYVAPFIADDGIDCFRKSLVQLLQEAVPDGTELLVQSQERAPQLGDSSIGYELVGTLTDARGNEETVYVDVIGVRIGRGFTGVTFQSANVPFPSEDSVAETATEKLEKAL